MFLIYIRTYVYDILSLYCAICTYIIYTYIYSIISAEYVDHNVSHAKSSPTEFPGLVQHTELPPGGEQCHYVLKNYRLCAPKVKPNPQRNDVMVLRCFKHQQKPLTLPETNIAPQNWWLGDYFPLGMVCF